MRFFLILVIASILIFGFQSLVAKSSLIPLDKKQKIAFLGLTFIDTSLDSDYFGVQEAETNRINLLETLVKERFTKEGFQFTSNELINSKLEDVINPAQCNGCEFKLAKMVDAGYVMVGEVHKVSNLILSVNLVMKDVNSKQIVRARVVDIRGNTDESWSRGMRYILKNHFFVKN